MTSSSPEALRAFGALNTDWRLASARARRTLTGVGYQANSLLPEQVSRAEMLVELDMDHARGLRRASWAGGWLTPADPLPFR